MLDIELLDEIDGKFNIKNLSFDNCKTNHKKFIEKIQNLESFYFTDNYPYIDSLELFHSHFKHDLKYFELVTSNSSFQGLEKIVENCYRLLKFSITNKYPFKRDEPFLQSLKKSKIIQLEYRLYDLQPILFESLEDLKLNHVKISLEIFTEFFESLNQHKNLKRLSLYPLEIFPIEHLKVIQKYLSINVTLKEFIILIRNLNSIKAHIFKNENSIK